MTHPSDNKLGNCYWLMGDRIVTHDGRIGKEVRAEG